MKRLLIIITVVSMLFLVGSAYAGLVDPIVNTNTNTNVNDNDNVNVNANLNSNRNNNVNANSNYNSNTNRNTNMNSNIQGQNQNQGQMQGQLQGQMQGQVGIVNDGDQIVNVEKPNTQIPTIVNINMEPYEGSVKDVTAEFAKYPLDGVVYANSDTVITSVVDVDKFKGVGMLNRWEARKHILKKVKKLEKKHGKICVIVTARDASMQYGFGGGSGGSANPTDFTGAAASGVVGYALNIATQMVSIEFCTCK